MGQLNDTVDMTNAEAVGEFLTAALNNMPQDALELLSGLGVSDSLPPEVWAATGNSAALADLVAADPAAVARKYGSRGWDLVLYSAFSCLHMASETHATGLADSVQLLLEAGANPNAYFLSSPPWEGARQTALYGATGYSNNPALARLLLEAGADPNDDESLYHSAEYMYTECLELLHEHGVDAARLSPHWNNTPLYFLAGYKEQDSNVETSIKGMRWLLDHGADPNTLCGDEQETALHAAARINRRKDLARLLLDAGADPGIRRKDGRTAYTLALRAGNSGFLELLKGLPGSDIELSDMDRFIGACAAGDAVLAREMVAADPELIDRLVDEDRQLLPEAADEGRSQSVALMLELGFPADATGRFGATALHLAAFRGDKDTVDVLLKADAPLEIRDPDFDATPLGWCTWASVSNPAPGADYPGVARMLAEAGAGLEGRASGTPEVEDALVRAGG